MNINYTIISKHTLFYCKYILLYTTYTIIVRYILLYRTYTIIVRYTLLYSMITIYCFVFNYKKK